MAHLNDHTDRAADLFDEAPTPAVAHLVATLDRAYRDTPPPALDDAMMRALRERGMAPRRPPRPARRFMFVPRRPGVRTLAAVGVLAATLGTGAALADPDLVQQALGLLSGGTDPRYVVSFDQSRTACGFTVTLKTAYADANRLVIGYEVRTPPTRAFGVVGVQAPVATDAHGTRLEPMNGSADSSDIAHMTGATRGNAQEFDTSGVLNGTPLRVHLVAPALSGEELVTGAAPAAPPCETDGPVTTRGANKPTRAVTVAGPFVFDVTVPLSPKVRATAPHVSGTSARGTTVTLERVVVTPTEARLYMRGPANGWYSPMIHAGGADYDVASGGPIGGGLWVWRFFPRPGSLFDHRAWLFDDHAEWTVNVLTDHVYTNGRGGWAGSVPLTVTVP